MTDEIAKLISLSDSDIVTSAVSGRRGFLHRTSVGNTAVGAAAVSLAGKSAMMQAATTNFGDGGSLGKWNNDAR
ncbi:MAG: hypothetical protein ACLPID_05205 [Beijerinckiaceae bacterium]